MKPVRFHDAARVELVNEVPYYATISSQVENTNVSKYGFWLLADDEELFLSFAEFPWFRDAPIGKLLNVAEKGVHPSVALMDSPRTRQLISVRMYVQFDVRRDLGHAQRPAYH